MTVLAPLLTTTEGLPVPSRRSSAHPIRARRALLVAAVTASAVLVPSVAWATTPTDVSCTVDQTVDGLTGGTPTCTSAPPSSTQTKEAAPATSTSAAPTLPSLDLSQLNALLAQAGIAPACSTSVEADIQQTLTDIPATAEELLQQILAALKEGGGQLTDPTTSKDVLMTVVDRGSSTVVQLSSPDPSELLLVEDIQQLLTDLLTKCLPAPPTLSTPPTTTPPPPAPPAAAQPVSYLGYAPTGGTGPVAPESDGSAPLAGLGAGLLLTGCAGVVWCRVRSRAARAQD